MKSSGKFENYIAFSIFSNIVVFNTLAGSGKKNGKGCCGSNKDKKTSVDNQNDTDNNNKDNNDPKSEEQNEEEKKKRKEELEKEKQNLNEQEKLRQNIENIKIKFNELKNNYDKLKSSNKNYFEISKFSINIKEADIKGITKENINNIETNLNNEVDKFNKTLKDQLDVLNKKFEDLKNNDNSSGENKYDTSDIENTLKNKENITVDSFISLDDNLKFYELTLTGSLDTLKNNVISKFNKDENKKLFELANKIKNTFNNDLEDKINSLRSLNALKEIQELAKKIDENLIKCNEIINTEKESLINEIKIANKTASDINTKLLLNKLGIELKAIDVIDKLTNVTEYEEITKNLADLQTKIAAIQGNLTEFLKDNFVENLLTKTGWEFIEEAEKFYDFITNFNNLDGDTLISLKIANANKGIEEIVKNINNKLSNDGNFYIALSEEKSGNDEYIYKFYKYKTNILDFKNEIKYENALTNEYVDDEIFEISKYIEFACEDINKVFFKKNFINEKKDNPEIIFLLSCDGLSYIFYSQVKIGYMGTLIFNEEFRDKIRKMKILYNSDNFNSMEDMFKNFKSLEELNIDNLNTTNVTKMISMFHGCKNLKKLDLSKFDTKQVIKMCYMFYDCEALEKLDLSNCNTENVTTMSCMFKNCINLIDIKLDNKFSTKNVEKMSSMFSNCKKISDIKLDNFDTRKVEDMSGMFSECAELNGITFNLNFLTQKVTDMSHMFSKCAKLKELDLSIITKNVTNMSYMFSECINLENIKNFENLDTQNVTDMAYMFYSCEKLIGIKLNNFNTEKVENMSRMFFNCKTLEELNFSSFNTKNVTSMSSMFDGCKNLKKLNLSKFNTLKVTNMENMFMDCENLEELNLINFNTENVTRMDNMFNGCKSLQKFIYSDYFVISKDFDDIFQSCCGLAKDLKNKIKKKDD